MSGELLGLLEWNGAIAGALAAFIISLDLGRRATGWAFGEESQGIGTQNIVLLAVNLIGVYRYLIRKKPVPEPA